METTRIVVKKQYVGRRIAEVVGTNRTRKWFGIIRVLGDGLFAAYNPSARAGDVTPICATRASAYTHIKRKYTLRRATEIAKQYADADNN